MKVGIIGWGVEGQSAFKYFGPEHEYLIVSEEPREDLPPESGKVQVQFNKIPRQPGVTGNAADLSYLNGIESCDKIVYTPTSRKNLEHIFPPDDNFWRKAVTNQHIFFKEVKTKNIIGVTGSKGKGTTSTLIANMLEASGKTVHLGGNIGRAVLDFVNEVQPDDWAVLELANFQLYKFPYSPHIAVCLMITEEHLDWHSAMEDYIEAKANICRHQTKEDITVYFSGNDISERIAGYSSGHKIPYYNSPGALVREDGMIVVGEDEIEVIHRRDIKLLGEHNLQNICAAVTAVWQIDTDLDGVRQVLSSFRGLEHRLEFVRELGSVKYYDDSFGTTPDTVEVALKSFSQPVILITGGHDKGADYEKMAVDLLKTRVKHVIAIGLIGERIAAALRAHGFTGVTTGLDKMTDMVNEAHKLASPGDIVLLSSGTSSFGLFKDYKDRGDQFKAAVRSLA